MEGQQKFFSEHSKSNYELNWCVIKGANANKGYPSRCIPL